MTTKELLKYKFPQYLSIFGLVEGRNSKSLIYFLDQSVNQINQTSTQIKFKLKPRDPELSVFHSSTDKCDEQIVLLFRNGYGTLGMFVGQIHAPILPNTTMLHQPSSSSSFPQWMRTDLLYLNQLDYLLNADRFFMHTDEYLNRQSSLLSNSFHEEDPSLTGTCLIFNYDKIKISSNQPLILSTISSGNPILNIDTVLYYENMYRPQTHRDVQMFSENIDPRDYKVIILGNLQRSAHAHSVAQSMLESYNQPQFISTNNESPSDQSPIIFLDYRQL